MGESGAVRLRCVKPREDDRRLLWPVRPIRWELIAQQYDQMIKYATAIRTRTASTEAILRRFTRNASHPAYAAMLEVGRAQRPSSWPATCG
ncbi:transposase [Streptomyces sp. NBC_01618]|nr:transposase [Streptomyces sp. NBC_01618]